MSDYHFLEDVVQIKKISQIIERLDIKIGESGYSVAKRERLTEQKNMYLA